MNTVRELVKALGGTEAVAVKLSEMNCFKRVGARAVEKWGDKNHVPYFWRPMIAALASANDQPLPADIAPWAAPLAQPPAPITVGTDAASTEAS